MIILRDFTFQCNKSPSFVSARTYSEKTSNATSAAFKIRNNDVTVRCPDLQDHTASIAALVLKTSFLFPSFEICKNASTP
jgi:hypothetical protein